MSTDAERILKLQQQISDLSDSVKLLAEVANKHADLLERLTDAMQKVTNKIAPRK